MSEVHEHTWRIWDYDGPRDAWIPVRNAFVGGAGGHEPFLHKGEDAEHALCKLLASRPDLGRNRYLVIHFDGAAKAQLMEFVPMPAFNVEMFTVRLPRAWRRNA